MESYGTFHTNIPSLSNSRARTTSLQGPTSGKTAGISAGLFALLDAKPLIKRARHARITKSTEGTFHASLDIAGLPTKVIISLLSCAKQIIEKIKVSSSLIKASLGAALSGVLIVLTILSAIYLVIESIRTVVELVKSLRFHAKEQIDKTLSILEKLTLSGDRDLEQVQEYIAANRIVIDSLLEDFQGMRLTGSINKKLLQLKAIILQRKIAQLYHQYVSNEAEPKKADYLGRRVGANTVDAFKTAASAIDEYDPHDPISPKNLLEVTFEEDLEDFIRRGTNILSFLERQRKKVLKIHTLSVATLAVTALALTTPIAHLAVSTSALVAISVGAGVVSGARGFAINTYLEHTGEGINPRLAIPKILCAKEGESNFSIWKGASTAKKVAYVIISILTAGLLVGFDALYKSSLITRLRGRADRFDHINATYSLENMTIPSIME
ncbi:hypothetical protein K0U07_00540 [bacterium]|nr:hypothetical protein [bacterium]